MKTILKPALILTVLCLVVTAAVAGVNLLTRDAIAAADKAAAEAGMAALIPNETFTPLTGSDLESAEAYQAKSGFVFVASCNGYGGPVKVMTAVDNAGAVIGVTVLNCDDETPGLGQNAKKAAFTDQFKGKSGSVELTKKGGEIAAVTSATYTSTAVKECVNAALRDYQKCKGGAQ
ncbi:MAG: FMN-binding protein [Clostridia bacterium]|nr:FMN-binding protein [Clostridia bacterium]